MENRVILAVALAAVTLPLSAQKRPNVLFILTDDLGARDLGCTGSTFYETPNLDALAADGVIFANSYTACPVSSPTRAAIMTGKNTARTGITDWIPGRQAASGKNDAYTLLPPEFTLSLPMDEVTLGQAFKEAGYATWFVGKWHLGEDPATWPEHRGFDVNVGGCKLGHPPSYFSPYKIPTLPDGPKGEYLTDRLAGECVTLLENRDTSKPFLLYYAMYQVHTPLQAKPEKIAYFREKADRLGLTMENCTTTDRDWIRDIPVEGKFVERTRQGHPVYAAMVSHMDDGVGRVVAKLKELGLYENTIIVFTSDNGGLSTAEGSPTSNAPLRTGKGWAYQGGVRSPMIVRWPGHARPGTVNASAVVSYDFYPTLLEMSGLPKRPAQHVDGVSFARAIRTGREAARGPVYWHYPHYSNQGERPFGMVIDGKYKLIENYEDMSVELYDLSADVSEERDIAAANPGVTSKMTGMLHRWRTQMGAKMPTPKKNRLVEITP